MSQPQERPYRHDMKNMVAFTALVEEPSAPVTLTMDGYDSFVVAHVFRQTQDYVRLVMSRGPDSRARGGRCRRIMR